MADLDKALEYVLVNEGGWSNHPEDPGGATKFGITIGVLKGMGRDYDLDGDGDVDEVDLSRLTKSGARDIYRRRYWRGDGILDQRVATKHFDCGVNMGVAVGTLLLQRVLVSRGYKLVVADGVFGPVTLAAVNDCPPASILLDFPQEMANRYYAIIASQARDHWQELGWAAPEADSICRLAQAHDLPTLLSIRDRFKASARRPGKLAFLAGWIHRAAEIPHE